jgi:hypothetical protein
MLVTVWFFYPETGGRSLEQIAIIFDGEGADLPLTKPQDKGLEDGHESAASHKEEV